MLPRILPISAFLTPRATPMRAPLTSRPNMVPAQCVPWPRNIAIAVAAEIHLDESDPIEGCMGAVNARIEHGHNRTVACRSGRVGAEPLRSPRHLRPPAVPARLSGRSTRGGHARRDRRNLRIASNVTQLAWLEAARHRSADGAGHPTRRSPGPQQKMDRCSQACRSSAKCYKYALNYPSRSPRPDPDHYNVHCPYLRITHFGGARGTQQVAPYPTPRRVDKLANAPASVRTWALVGGHNRPQGLGSLKGKRPRATAPRCCPIASATSCK